MALTDKLLGGWRLNEESGDRADVTGNGFTLTETNGTLGNSHGWLMEDGVTSPGLFVPEDGAWLRRQGSPVPTDSSWTITFWAQLLRTGGTAMMVLGEWGNAGDDKFLIFWHAPVNSYRMHASNDGSTVTASVYNDGSLSGALGDWHFVEAYYDHTEGEVGIAMDGGTFNTGAITGPLHDSSEDLTLGAFNTGNSFDGTLQEVMVWDGLLTPTERATLIQGDAHTAVSPSYPWTGEPLHENQSLIDPYGLCSRDNQGTSIPNWGNPQAYIFREPAIVSRDIGGTTYQAAVYWDRDYYLVVATREDYGAWTLTRLDGNDGRLLFAVATRPHGTNVIDFHKTATCNIDANGRIHVAGDVHGEPLRYFISTNPIGTFDGAFGVDQHPLVNDNDEGMATYPSIFTSPSGVLHLIYRSGGSDDSDWHWYTYDAGADSWGPVSGSFNAAGRVIEGTTESVGPYAFGPPRFDGSGNAYLTWTVRQPAGNDHQDLHCMVWTGSGFETIDGTTITDDENVLRASPTVIVEIDSDQNLHNTCSTAVDDSGRLHVAAVWDNASGDLTIRDVVVDGASASTHDVVTLPAGTGIYTFGRPSVAARDGSTYIFTTVPEDEEGLRIYRSSDLETWTELKPLGAVTIGHYEVDYDRTRWDDDGVLDMLLTPRVETDGNVPVTEFGITQEDLSPDAGGGQVGMYAGLIGSGQF